MSRHIEGGISQPSSENPFRQRLANGVENSINFMRVSPQLHLLNALLGSSGGLSIVEYTSNGNNTMAMTQGVLTGISLAVNEYKSYKNLKRYKKLKRRFHTDGWDESAVRPMLHWWCGRYAARRAAIETGYKEEIKSFYKATNRSWINIYQG